MASKNNWVLGVSGRQMAVLYTHYQK